MRNHRGLLMLADLRVLTMLFFCSLDQYISCFTVILAKAHRFEASAKKPRYALTFSDLMDDKAEAFSRNIEGVFYSFPSCSLCLSRIRQSSYAAVDQLCWLPFGELFKIITFAGFVFPSVFKLLDDRFVLKKNPIKCINQVLFLLSDKHSFKYVCITYVKVSVKLFIA